MNQQTEAQGLVPSPFEGDWWDLSGPHKLLHQVNPVRLRYAKDRLGDLRGRRIADVGCGGGIFSEALASEGAEVVGIDALESAIQCARGHQSVSGVNVEYVCADIEDFAQEHTGSFDAVMCMEMLEHVDKPAQAVVSLASLLKPGGELVASTINRTVKSCALMIFGLEVVLRALAPGTHRYNQFIRPNELEDWCRDAGLHVLHTSGMTYSHFGKAYLLDESDHSVNYLLHARHESNA